MLITEAIPLHLNYIQMFKQAWEAFHFSIDIKLYEEIWYKFLKAAAQELLALPTIYVHANSILMLVIYCMMPGNLH